MGRIKLNKVSYSGDNYHYDLSNLNDGINLIVGDNGSGKSTLCFFVYYVLGGNVSQFKLDDKKQKTKNKK